MIGSQTTGLSVQEQQEIGEAAVAQVRRWLADSANEPMDAAATQLAGLLRDPDGLGFAVGFVDRVVRPEDSRVAAAALRELAGTPPRFLNPVLRLGIRLGGLLAPVLPDLIVPIARAVLRHMVRHLIVDATPQRLGKAIDKIRSAPGVRLNVNLLGEAILGPQEAARRLAGTRQLLERPDVDYVSIKVSATVAPHTPWAFDAAVDDAVEALRPLLRAAAASRPRTFVNLDMEEYKDLEITLAVFTRLLEEPEFHQIEAGIVLQAYLPDALSAMIRLQKWAAQRIASGGAPIKIRVVKGANLPMEQVDAQVHGWPLATWPTKQASDASYKAVLEYALRPEHTPAVRIGVAGHNLFDIAFAWELATRRGVTEAVEIEMLIGMAPAQAAAVRRSVGSILLYTPVVHPGEFDVAIAYLIRRLEEGASQENFMSAVFELGTDSALFTREKERFLASLADLPGDVPMSHRVQDRTVAPEPWPGGFTSTADSDPSIPVNQAWGRGIRSRMATSRLGDSLAATRVPDAAAVAGIIETGVAAGAAWRALGAAGRAEILHRAGQIMERRRADLLEVMGAECGKVLEQSDPEVSEAIDFAHYYATQAIEVAQIPGAVSEPVGLTVVTPPWNFPVAIPAGSTLAALAAGSPVILKPARQAARCAAVLTECLWEAGVPPEVLQYVLLAEPGLGETLIGHPSVERVILTGSIETAQLFRSFRADLPLLAETSGKNAVIVTPHADLDLAAKDVAASAFGHAGQKCSAASLVVLVGSVATSQRFRRQLVDAVQAYEVGMPWQEASRIGPLIGPASGKLLRALTTLEPGQSWLLPPEQLDEAGALWRPGIREGVQPGSEFHLTEYFGPVLGIITAPDLAEAIRIVNAVDYGLTSGLHSLDEAEIQHWLAQIEAGNAYVNRGTTGAIVARQPFGGWKRSAVGAGTKAGGPSYLVGLSAWQDQPVSASAPTDYLSASLAAAARTAELAPASQEWLAGALSTDVAAWAEEFSVVRDVTALECEQNVLRYQAVPVTIRDEAGDVAALVRVVAAGARTSAALTVSLAGGVPEPVKTWIERYAITVVEDEAAWAGRVARLAERGGRIRLLGGDPAVVATLADGAPSLAIYAGPVLSAGRIELLTFLREQAVSLTAHRFGTPLHHRVPVLAPAREA